MAKITSIRRHKDPRECAREIHDYIDATYRDHRLFENPLIAALYNDAGGLLSGISQGTIKTGQPRIVEQLIRIVQNYPTGRDPGAFVEAIGAAGEFGLTAEKHSLPGILRSPPEIQRK